MSNDINFAEIIQLIKPAPPLPVAGGNIVRVNSAEGIIDAVSNAQPNSTIIIAKGRYLMPHDCLLTASNVCIRGETGNYDDVVLDGGVDGSKPFDDEGPQFKKTVHQQAILKISKASDVTVADITFANCAKYGLTFLGGGGITNLKILHCKFHNIWARGIKGTGSYVEGGKNFVPMDYMSDEEFNKVAPRNGEIRNCLFLADTVKMNDKDGFDGDYIAGMDLMGTKDFVIADNTFIGIRGKNGGGRGSIFIWQQAENVTVENNHFYHCDKGISLGNPSAQDKRLYHIRDSVIRNNTIIGGCNKGIEVDYGDNVSVLNNIIESDIRKDFAAIQMLNISSKSLVEENTIKSAGAEPFNCCATVHIGKNNVASFDS